MIDIFLHEFVDKKGYIKVLEGLGNTVLIAIGGLLIGILLGALVSIAVVKPQKGVFGKIMNGICKVYVGFFRGTPLVVQLLLMYWAVVPMLVTPNALAVAIVVFGINSGAYVAEIMRGGINSIDKGQMEAGRSLGFGYGKTMILIVLPQAIKNIVPMLCNEFIALVKDTSVAGMITVLDVTRAFQNIAGTTFEYMIPYSVLALIYLVLVGLITILARWIERRFAREER